MCNEYGLEIALMKLRKELSRLGFPPFEWLDNLIPNNLEKRSSVKIRDNPSPSTERHARCSNAPQEWQRHRCHASVGLESSDAAQAENLSDIGRLLRSRHRGAVNESGIGSMGFEAQYLPSGFRERD